MRWRSSSSTKWSTQRGLRPSSKHCANSAVSPRLASTWRSSSAPASVERVPPEKSATTWREPTSVKSRGCCWAARMILAFDMQIPYRVSYNHASKICNKSTGGSLQESGSPLPCQLSYAAGSRHRAGRRRRGRVGTAGSGKVISGAPACPTATRPSPRVAKSPYSASKIAGEALLYSYARCYSLPMLVFRFSNVYGRFDNDLDRMERVIPLFVRKIYDGEPITVYGRDKMLDFTYVDDCISGLVPGINGLVEGRLVNQTLNVPFSKC